MHPSIRIKSEQLARTPKTIYFEARRAGGAAGLNHDSALSLIDEAGDFAPEDCGGPAPEFSFIGDDPLARQGIFQLVRHAADRDLWTSLNLHNSSRASQQALGTLRRMGLE